MEVGDPTTIVDAMRAKVASSPIREECVQAHAVSGELVPNDKVHHNEPCSNGVSKDDSDQSAVLPGGKTFKCLTPRRMSRSHDIREECSRLSLVPTLPRFLLESRESVG